MTGVDTSHVIGTPSSLSRRCSSRANKTVINLVVPVIEVGHACSEGLVHLGRSFEKYVFSLPVARAAKYILLETQPGIHEVDETLTACVPYFYDRHNQVDDCLVRARATAPTERGRRAYHRDLCPPRSCCDGYVIHVTRLADSN